ncbi:hypothetical protein F5Y10DRAFT_172808 [Nemania abortiva]|nr:hypothetical protein F5Y10DRAFT_172808 [Nemania abortiva]
MMDLLACAASIQENGATIVLYEPGGMGINRGLSPLPSADTNRAVMFGFSFGGSVAPAIMTIDPRSRVIVTAASLTTGISYC